MTFTVSSGSASFAGAQSTTATTGSDGVATAPVTLKAGTSAGAVSVTTTVAGSPQTTQFDETVTGTGPARSDLAITITAPRTVSAGGTATITVTVSNKGPSAASHVLAAVLVAPKLLITGNGGGRQHGQLILYQVASLDPGKDATFTITASRRPGASGLELIGAATTSATRDPVPWNNTALDFVSLPASPGDGHRHRAWDCPSGEAQRILAQSSMQVSGHLSTRAGASSTICRTLPRAASSPGLAQFSHLLWDGRAA